MSLPIPFPTSYLIESKTGIGYMRNLLIPGAFDYDVWQDDFKGDAMLDEYPAAKTNGTSAAVTFTEHNTYGYIDLVTGTDDNGYAGQGVGLHWNGDRGLLAEILFKTPSAITTLKFEMGMSDADDDSGAILLKATPTLTATDCAVICFDTDDDTYFSCISANGGTATATQDITSVAVAASTFYIASIRIQGDSVSYYINGTEVAGHDNGIEGGTDLTLWAFAQARTGSASRTVQLHKWRVIQPAYS